MTVADTDSLIVPTSSLLDIFMRVLQQRDENAALQAIAAMRQDHVVTLEDETGLNAAKRGVDNRLPPTETVILATAHQHDATLWTQDKAFEGLDDLHYIAKS